MTGATQHHPVVLYARVSSQRDDRSASVDDQLAELRRWASREGWHVVDEFRDDSVSASRYAGGKARPGWERAMNMVTAGRVRALLVWELSRATRDRKVSAALEAACAARGVKIGYKGRLHDPATADGEFSVGLDGLLAARESAMTSERVRKNIEETRAPSGRPHGALPYGYRRRIDPRTGRTAEWEIDPVHGPIVAEIVRRLLDREPANAIATDLNERGVTTGTGRRWRAGNLAKMALRAAYAGMRTHHGEVLDGVIAEWPRLIDPDDHHRLRALFGSPDRDKWRNSTAVKHLGTGIFRCGRDSCEGRMRVAVEAGKPSRYDCRTCHRVSRLQEPVDEFVERVIVARLSRSDALDALSGPDRDEQRREAAAEATALRAEETDMHELLRQRRLTPGDLAVWREGWAPRIAAAEAAARPPDLPGGINELTGPDAEKRWADASIATRRAVLDALMVVTILPMGYGGQPFVPSSVDIAWRE